MDTWQIEILFFSAEIILLLSYLPSKILWLRIIAISADILFIIATLLIGLHAPGMLPTFTFAILGMLVNIYHVYKITQMSFPCDIPENLQACYNKLFADFTHKEYMTLLKAAECKKQKNMKIITDNTFADLILLIQGSVIISKKDSEVNQIGPCNILGEISYLTGGKAIANVLAKQEITYFHFDIKKLEKLFSTYPDIQTKFRKVLLNSIATKLAEQNEKFAARKIQHLDYFIN